MPAASHPRSKQNREALATTNRQARDSLATAPGKGWRSCQTSSSVTRQSEGSCLPSSQHIPLTRTGVSRWTNALADLGRRASPAELAGYTLGWCYPHRVGSNGFRPKALLAELRQRLPGTNWVGWSVGIGVCAEGISGEYIGGPAVVLMLAPLSRDAFQGLLRSVSHFAQARLISRRTRPSFHADGSAPDLQELLPRLARTHRDRLSLPAGLSSSRTLALQVAETRLLAGGLSRVAFSDRVSASLIAGSIGDASRSVRCEGPQGRRTARSSSSMDGRAEAARSKIWASARHCLRAD